MADISNPKEFLEGLLTAVDARDAAQSTLTKDEEEKRGLSGQLSTLKDTIEKEKNETLRKRKIDLEAGYDKQIRAADKEIRSIEDQRQKTLNEAIKKRTQEATKGTLESAANDEKAFKAYVNAQKLPIFMRSKAYFKLFCTTLAGYIALFGIFLVILIIALIGIRANSPAGGWPFAFFAGLLVVDLAALIAYVLIWTNTRVKYRDQISAAKEILKSVAQSKNTARDIEKNIRRAGDDQSYGLESFDQKLSEKNAAKAGIEAQKAQALSNFENEIKNKLKSDIDANYKTRIDELNQKIGELDYSIGDARNTLNQQEALLTSDYVTFVGADNLTHDRASRLLGFINDGSAATVTEAVSKLKNS